jgi:hypothetical protein
MPPEGEEDPKLAGTLAGRGDTVTCGQSRTASLHLRLVHLAAQRDISPDGSPASFPRGATGGHGAIPAGRADPRVHLRGRATLPDRHHPHLRERRSVLPAGIPERGSVSGSIGERPARSRRSAASSSRTPRGSAGQPPCHSNSRSARPRAQRASRTRRGSRRNRRRAAAGPYRLPIGGFPPAAEPRPILASYDGAAELECGLGILLTGLTTTLIPGDVMPSQRIRPLGRRSADGIRYVIDWAAVPCTRSSGSRRSS